MILQVQFSFVVNLLIFFLPVMCSKCFFKPHVIFPMFPTVTGMFINFVMNVSFWRPRLHPEVLELTSHTVAALGGLLPSSSLDGIECLNRQFTYRALYITQWHKVIGLTHSLTRSLARSTQIYTTLNFISAIMSAKFSLLLITHGKSC